MLGFTYTEAKEIINEVGRFEIVEWEHYGLTVIATEDAEYAVGYEEDTHYSAYDAVGSLLEEDAYDMPDNYKQYMDFEAMISDILWDDGNGNALSSYDGEQIDLDCQLELYRIA